MEFRCRLGTPGGEIIEGVYVADSEARLRRELEEKGLFVLSLQRRAGCSRPRRSAFGGAGAIASSEFLVFNQELATLLKAGMPLVQSLDILRQRVANPTFKAVLDDVYEKVKAGAALSDAFAEHGALFPARLLGVADGGGAQRQPRRGDPPLRRVREGHRRASGGKTISALIYPAILVALMVVAGRHHRAAGGAGVLGLLRELRPRAAARRRAIIVGVSNVVVANIWLILLVVVGGVGGGVLAWVAAARPARAHRSLLLRLPWAGDTPEVRDLAAGADAGDAARRRHPAGQRARDRRRGR